MAKSIRAKMAKSGQNGQKCGIYTHPPPTDKLIDKDRGECTFDKAKTRKRYKNKRLPPKNPVYPSPDTSQVADYAPIARNRGFPRGTSYPPPQVPGIDPGEVQNVVQGVQNHQKGVPGIDKID